MVTILFTDIRGFTAFCESKDPAVVVDLLNVYMKTMVAIIVKYRGHVNKFIGDGILAVFSDDDEGAKPGDHAYPGRGLRDRDGHRRRASSIPAPGCIRAKWSSATSDRLTKWSSRSSATR